MVSVPGESRTASEFEDSYDDERIVTGTMFQEPLESVPRRPLVIVSCKDTIAQAIDAMNARHTGCVLVVSEGRLVGIFTERDVLRKVVGKIIDVQTTPVEQVMTAEPDTLPGHASIGFALRAMSVEGYRHIPLVDDHGRPIAVVAVRDIVAWMVSQFPDSVHNLPPEPRFPSSVDGG